MKSIDEYITQVDNMPNISDGGSPAYSFDDVVLVKYSIPTKYGLARKDEELIAQAANSKNAKGVKTPAHLSIKRTYEREENICWVLQEKAKGVSFENYYSFHNDAQTQLRLQQELLDAPDYHYEKCITDLSELFHMGLELKPKNIFYDNSKDDGGFTFIDLLGYDLTPMNPNSINDVLWLDKHARFICNFTQIFSHDKDATLIEKNQSLKLYYKIRKKIFVAMEKVLPNFNQFRRWVLRSYSKDLLDFFEKDGIFIGDLSLTEQEYEQFDNYIEIIVNECIKNISTGKVQFWEVEVNEIRNMLDEMGMREAWNIHHSNPVKDPEDYEDEWDFEYARKKSLDDLVNDIFNKKLGQIAQNSSNSHILQAKKDLDKKMIKDQRKL